MQDILNTTDSISRELRAGLHNSLEAGIEQIDAENAIRKEECSAQRLHIPDMEEIEWQQWHLGNPSLNITCASKEQASEGERDVDVRCPPTVGCVGTTSDGKD